MVSSDDSARLNFRMSEDEQKTLEELAESSGVSTSEAMRVLIRAAYRLKFSGRAEKFETASERFERQIFELASSKSKR